MTDKQRFLGKVKENGPESCWPWTACRNPKGYGQFRFEGGMKQAHRVAYQLFVGQVPAGLMVLHKCDLPACVNPKHLFLGTNADNMDDMVRKNRQSRLQGAKHGRAKLTSRAVLKIRTAQGTNKALSVRFGVSRSLIGQIKARQIWKHL